VARQRRYGPNQLAEPPAPSALVVLLRQFRSPLIYILIGAVAVTTALGDYLDAAVIAAVLAINATVGFVQERKADHAVRALAQMVVPRTRVVRDGAGAGSWLRILAVAVSVPLVVELDKLLRRRGAGTNTSLPSTIRT